MAPETIPEAWTRRLGVYEVLNPDERNFIRRVEMRMQDGLLLLDISIPCADMAATDLSVNVKPISDSVALLRGIGRMPYIDGILHAEEDNGSVRLRYSGFVLERRQ